MSHVHMLLSALVAFAAVGSLAAPGDSMGGFMAGIPLNEARSLLQAGLDAMATVAGLRQCIVVLDASGILKAAACADGARPIANNLAIQKAKTALDFGAAYNNTVLEFVPGRPLYKLDTVLSFTNLRGSIPLFDASNVVRGAIGVSGGSTSDQDWVSLRLLWGALSVLIEGCTCAPGAELFSLPSPR
jgi:uncharacterized protein GlcG (DUF336 family)